MLDSIARILRDFPLIVHPLKLMLVRPVDPERYILASGGRLRRQRRQPRRQRLRALCRIRSRHRYTASRVLAREDRRRSNGPTCSVRRRSAPSASLVVRCRPPAFRILPPARARACGSLGVSADEVSCRFDILVGVCHVWYMTGALEPHDFDSGQRVGESRHHPGIRWRTLTPIVSITGR